MKRIFALMLALAMALSLVACAEEPAPIPTAGEEIETTAATEGATTEAYTFEELTIYESDMCSIVVTDIDAENPNGYALNLTISNNTEAEEVQKVEYVYETNEDGEQEIVEEHEYTETITTNLAFVLESAKINGTDVEISFSSDAESGMRNYDQLVLDADLISSLGEINEIELAFRVYDTATPDTTIASATGVIYPNGAPVAE